MKAGFKMKAPVHALIKKQKLILCSSGMVVTASAGLSVVLSASERPNIVFILTDDQRWDSLGCYGNPVIQTPNIDRLAENGTLFANSFVTTSICMVSRASILTGQYARRHGINDFYAILSPAQMSQTYPVLLRDSGYFTGFIGKWGIGNTVEATNLGAEYFDYWAGVSHQGNYWHERTCNHVLHDGIHDKTSNVCDCPCQQRGDRTVCGPEVRVGKSNLQDPVHYTTEVIPEKFRAFLSSRDPRKPFNMSISLKEPHNPFDYAPEFKAFFKGVPMPIRSNATVEAAGNKEYAHRSKISTKMEFVENQELDGPLQERLRNYYRMIAQADSAVGQILIALEEAGVSDNTVIIYTSDNGYLIGEHGLTGKWLPYEESLRVPAILYDPRSPKKHECREMVLNIDMAPTMLDLAGVEIPAMLQGKSLLPLLKNPQPQGPFRTEWFYEHHHDGSGRIQPTEAVISGEWKYIKYLKYEDAGSEELYQLSSDPYELTDLSGHPEFNDVLRRLRDGMDTYRETLK
jgi:arylsulfatase A-like enzyme